MNDNNFRRRLMLQCNSVIEIWPKNSDTERIVVRSISKGSLPSIDDAKSGTVYGVDYALILRNCSNTSGNSYKEYRHKRLRVTYTIYMRDYLDTTINGTVILPASYGTGTNAPEVTIWSGVVDYRIDTNNKEWVSDGKEPDVIITKIEALS